MKVQIAEAFQDLFKPKRYKVYYGGRGGAKSWGFAQAALIIAAQKKTRILCTREFQGSIMDSVHKLLTDTIERLGMNGFYDIQKSIIRGQNGSEIIFEGLKNNVTKIKSMEGVDICWCEEAESITDYSWDVLIPTIRKPGSEIWVSFNPKDELDATYQRFVLDPPSNSVVKRVGWQDNPWFPKELMDEMVECKKKNHKKWLHIWEGEPNSDYEDSIIQPEWVDAAIDAHKKLNWKPMGVKALGFDPADSGDDAKALAIRHGSYVSSVMQWSDGELPEAIDKAFSVAYENRVDHIVYDGDGLGAGVKVGLDKRIAGKNIQVDNYKGGLSGKGMDNPEELYMGGKPNKDEFRNKRAQYWWYLRDRFEATYNAVVKGIYSDPELMISLSQDITDLSALKSELCRVQRKRGNNSFIQLESKQEMRSRGVKSPNMADALVMCFANKPPKAKVVNIQFTGWG